ncbi:MAG: hypothetical protein U1E76_05315 [Planctomycetota bacterium]
MRALPLMLTVLASCARAPDGSAPRVRCGRHGIACQGALRALEDEHGAAIAFRTLALARGTLALFPIRAAQRYTLRLEDGERLDVDCPAKPEPIPVVDVDLAATFPFDPEIHRRHVPTVLRFDAQGRRLYVGTSEGFQALVALPSGRVTSLPRLPFAYVRQAEFSADGTRLYVGDQSHAASIRAYALHDSTVTPLWTFPLFAPVRELPAGAVDPDYAWAHEPGAYRLLLLGEDLLVVANHSWTAGGLTFGNQARVFRLDQDGRARWSWPADAPTPLKITWGDEQDGVVGLVAHFAEHAQAETPLPERWRPGTLFVLDAANGAQLASTTLAPLSPPFAHVECWRGTAVGNDGHTIAAALDDGRVLAFDLARARLSAPRTLDLTTPLAVGGTPVLATAGTVARAGRSLLIATGSTYTPWILRAEDVRPPQPHPNGRTLFSFDFALQLQWLMPLENEVEGLAVSQGLEPTIAVSLARVADPEPGEVNGVSVFDTAQAGGGIDKLRYTFTFAGNAPYDALAISKDGELIAAVEMPYQPRQGGASIGSARLHVFH